MLNSPWPWYTAGVLIGLIVPALLILGNKKFGISSNLRHMCAICAPSNIPFFQYDWKKEIWNFFFIGGIAIGAFIASFYMTDPNTVVVDENLKQDLAQYGITDFSNIVPVDLFSFESLFSLRGFIMMVVGGFLVGFGTRYAGGCTSGHAIMGLSNLQWPSLVATISFMVGGIIMTHLILPYILAL